MESIGIRRILSLLFAAMLMCSCAIPLSSGSAVKAVPQIPDSEEPDSPTNYKPTRKKWRMTTAERTWAIVGGVAMTALGIAALAVGDNGDDDMMVGMPIVFGPVMLLFGIIGGE